MIGKQIHNYHILKLLGEGGMAYVFLAENQVLGNKVAIKILKDDFVRNQNIRKRFIAEGRNLVNMSHPNIVKVVDLIDAGDIVALVLEYIEGTTLTEYITQHGKLSDYEIKTLFGEMLEAVKYIHSKGIIHRDIKPSNFMISNDKKLKLLDFGIAKNTNDSGNEYTATSLNQQMGTPIYMSPEQVRGQSITERTDIYSLGVVLWYLVMGKPLYNSSEISFFDLQLKIVQEDLPLTDTHWDTIIQKATQKEERKRFQSADEFLMAMEKKEVVEDDFERTVLDHKIILTEQKKIDVTKNQKEKGRKKRIVFLASIGFLLMVGFFFVFNYLANIKLNAKKQNYAFSLKEKKDNEIEKSKRQNKLDSLNLISEQKTKDSLKFLFELEEKSKINIGDYYQGGIVFKIVKNSEHGLVYHDHIPSCDYEEAKKICRSLNVNGFGNWRLPSITELGYIYKEMFSKLKRKKGFIDPYTSIGSHSYVWSSTETYEKVENVYSGDPASDGAELHTWVYSFVVKGHGAICWRKCTIKGKWGAIAVREF